MSIDDDRPRGSGDYASGGSFARGSEAYAGSPYGTPRESGPGGFFEESGFSGEGYSGEQTTVLPGPSPYDAITEEPPPPVRPGWHGGADLGLLVLRLVLGGLMVGHALQQLFGWFQGAGIGGLERVLAGFGFSNTTVLAWVTGVSELVGGTLVALGLFTPAGAAAILGVMASAIVVKINGRLFAGGVELESMYAAAAFAILFAGPGRVSLDRPTPWYRHATAYGFAFLLVAAAAAVTILIVFR